MKRAISIAVLALPLAGCGRFFDCYDATHVGSAVNQIIVVHSKTGKRHEMHFWNSDWVLRVLHSWEQGDELVVCNDMVTNKTKKSSAPCGDFGCLAPWP